MSSSVQPNWLRPGYADIVDARLLDDQIEVRFGNDDVVKVPGTVVGLLARPVAVEPGDEGLALRATFEDRDPVDVGWAQIRAATDDSFAHELRRQDAEEARHIGLRIKALREDRGLTQRQLADLVVMPPPQLSKIESGAFDLRVSTVRSLLRAMGASFRDIADPDALEVSARELRRRAEHAGAPRDLIDRLLSASPRPLVPRLLARAFAWAADAVLAGHPPATVPAVAVQFKATHGEPPMTSPLVALGYTVSQLVDGLVDLPPYKPLSASPESIHMAVTGGRRHVTLPLILRWAWGSGIPILPLVGRGAFTASAWEVAERPVIIVKESRNLAVYWLFDIAHELGHIALGHLGGGAIVDVESPTPISGTDAQEKEANDFALELLIPGHIEVLRAVRQRTQGNYLRFKGAVEWVANRANISPGLLGMIAAYEMPDVGREKDRWGSATNLAKLEGPGREVAQEAAREYLRVDALSELDRLILDAVVLSTAGG